MAGRWSWRGGVGAGAGVARIAGAPAGTGMTLVPAAQRLVAAVPGIPRPRPPGTRVRGGFDSARS